MKRSARKLEKIGLEEAKTYIGKFLYIDRNLVEGKILFDNNIINEGLKARAVFNSNIVPIMGAQQRRQEAINNWNKDFDKKARYIGNSPLETSITDWMNGATPNIYNIKGSDVAELSKNLTLGVTTDLLDDSDIQKITQGINPDSLYNIIYSIEQGTDSNLTNKEKYQKQHLNSIINTVKADYDFNSLTEAQQNQFMKEVYTGILLGNVYNEELKKSGNSGNTKDGLISLSDLKTVPLDTTSLLSPNIRNKNNPKEIISETSNYYTDLIDDKGNFIMSPNSKEGKEAIIISIVLNKNDGIVQNYIQNEINSLNTPPELAGLAQARAGKEARKHLYDTLVPQLLENEGIHRDSKGGIDMNSVPEDILSEMNRLVQSVENKDYYKKSYLANFHQIKYANPDKIAKYIIDKAGKNAGEDNLSIKKVKQFKPEQTEQGTKLKWEFDEGKAIKKEDFEWDNENNYIGSTPFFYRSMVKSDNPGLVMDIGDVSYFVPSSLLGGIDQSESYLHNYTIENDEYDSALKALEDDAESKNYLNADGSWKEESEKDQMFNLLYTQVLTALSAKKAASAQFTGNLADLFYTIENPTYKH